MSLSYFVNPNSRYYIGNIKSIDHFVNTPAATTPVTLAEAKENLNIEAAETSYDTYITDLIVAVTDLIEKATGRDLINKTYYTYLDCFPLSSIQGIEIQKSKLQSITSIEYLLSSVLTTFNASNYYKTEEADYSSIYLLDTSSWPSNVDNRRQAVKITFVSGYGETDADVPELIKRAILAEIATLFENRGDCSDCEGSFKSMQAESLIKPYILAKQRVRVF